MPIPSYPEFAAISLDMREELLPALNQTPDGISEFTFSNLYLFRGTYGYRLSKVSDGVLLVEGAKQGKSFFYVPFGLPPDEVLRQMMDRKDYLKNFSERQVAEHGDRLRAMGYDIVEDRDNFDYIYERRDLADLVGKSYHKKRNLVNAFTNAYACDSHILTRDNLDDAFEVLDEWAKAKGEPGDFDASKEALERYDVLGMQGCLYYVDDRPVGWCL
ncbi:MAG TPA: phosphatidylglycerol lysyltransferase domain-containing protein, partial [Rectinemataceae bacterium]|nr:phosphatidylglycerol lysyltransferase domain-containing protein [Rectinemataceae bacterium]